MGNVARYYPSSDDIIIGGPIGRNYNCQVREISGRPVTWTVWGTVILTNRVDTGSGWRYTVRYGWYPTVEMWMYMDIAYFTLSLNINGNYASYSSSDNHGVLEMGSRNTYWMLTGTTSIVLPYGCPITGSLNVTTYRAFMNDFNYGGGFSSSGGGPSVTPPSPKPSPPTGFYFNNPSSITSTSAYVDMGYTANSSQDSYYHMGFYDNNGRYYRANPARSGRSGNLTYYRNTISGLSPETTYVWSCNMLAGNEYIGTTGNRTFTTLSQDKLYIKVNGSWRLGFAYEKVNGSWVRGKQAYLKVNGSWTRARDL